jgi:hypothetical protein
MDRSNGIAGLAIAMLSIFRQEEGYLRLRGKTVPAVQVSINPILAVDGGYLGLGSEGLGESSTFAGTA